MTSILFILSLLVLGLSNVMTEARVPAAQTFTYVNKGEFRPSYNIEYNAQYRALPLAASIFELCFYNTTPDAFYLALRMGSPDSRWVWEANRGRPVRENATLSLHSDGNLILAGADRHIIWSTATANKGVVGLKLLPTGNLVLYDAHGRFVWQSFNYPTDTLLAGQSLRVGGPTRLVSRSSDGSFGKYSLMLDSEGSALYVNTMIHASAKILPYYQMGITMSNMLRNFSSSMSMTKYNATFAFLRLTTDGDQVIYTFSDSATFRRWEQIYSLFSKETGMGSACARPSKCGELGVCENEKCVACPTPEGLQGWRKDCRPMKFGSCTRGRVGGVGYYKVVGVENFLCSNVRGVAVGEVEDCKKRCNEDCGCKGFMYWEESSTCWLAPLLGTLTKVSNSSHVAYIKYNKVEGAGKYSSIS